MHYACTTACTLHDAVVRWYDGRGAGTTAVHAVHDDDDRLVALLQLHDRHDAVAAGIPQMSFVTYTPFLKFRRFP